MWSWRRREVATVATAPGSPGAGTLSAEEQARIKRIEVRTRRLASSALGGDYRSVFRGTGIEFSEAREYVPGDDVRFIDWNVTARMGSPWVKEFVEERELSIATDQTERGKPPGVETHSGKQNPCCRLTSQGPRFPEFFIMPHFTACLQHTMIGL